MRWGLFFSGVSAGFLVCFGAFGEPKQEKKDEEKEAVFSFSGKRGKPAKVIDHRTGDAQTFEGRITIRNQSTADAMAAADARRSAAVDRVRERLEKAAAEEAASAASEEAAAPEGGADEGLSTAEGLALLREQNWMTFDSGGGPTPAVVYNPQTKRFVPTAEAIRGLEQSGAGQRSGASKGSGAPGPRKADPTP